MQILTADIINIVACAYSCISKSCGKMCVGETVCIGILHIFAVVKISVML